MLVKNRPAAGSDGLQDLRELPWASIDNDDSRDLDQLSVAEADGPGRVKLLVAVADVTIESSATPITLIALMLGAATLALAAALIAKEPAGEVSVGPEAAAEAARRA